MKARIPGAQQGGSANMMKKIQEMQEEMARVQQEVEETEFTARPRGGDRRALLHRQRRRRSC